MRQQEKDQRRLEARTSARRDRALDEIDSSVGRLFWAIHRVAFFASAKVRASYPAVGWELLLSDEVLPDLEEFDMVHLSPPPHMSGPYAFPLGTDTRNLVDVVTEEGHAHLDRLTAIADLSGEVLEADEIDALGCLTTHPFMAWMANLREHFAKIRHIEDSDRYLLSLIPRHVALGGTPDEFRDFAAQAIWLRDRVRTSRSSPAKPADDRPDFAAHAPPVRRISAVAGRAL
jgi:hypothetical protein